MNAYCFTDRVRKVLEIAREEAARLGHKYVGTEHILLGLIREGDGVALAVLTNLNVNLEAIRKNIEDTVKKGRAALTEPDLPYTSRAKYVLEFALGEARALNHSHVGTEHLLLGLLHEARGIAARVLTEAGVSLEQARAETLRSVGKPGGPWATKLHSGRVWLRAFAGIVFIGSGVEALGYAPGWQGKMIGALSAGGGLLLLLGYGRSWIRR